MMTKMERVDLLFTDRNDHNARITNLGAESGSVYLTNKIFNVAQPEPTQAAEKLRII